MSSITEEIYFTLEYMDPQLTCRNPVMFDWERKEYTFCAADDNDARQKARLFLMQGVVSCNHVTGRRKGKILRQDHPSAVVQDFFPVEKLNLTLV